MFEDVNVYKLLENYCRILGHPTYPCVYYRPVPQNKSMYKAIVYLRPSGTEYESKASTIKDAVEAALTKAAKANLLYTEVDDVQHKMYKLTESLTASEKDALCERFKAMFSDYIY